MHGLHKLLLFCLLTRVEENALGSEIINGGKVPDDLMLYMGSVQNDKGQHICGGFLISEDFVVTAAHCDNRQNPTNVVLGTHNLHKVQESMRHKVKRCKYPPYKDFRQGDDIMLLKLLKKVRLSSRVQPVALPKAPAPVADNTKCRVAGWGRTQTKGNTSTLLKSAVVSIIDQKTCRDVWAKVRKQPLPRNITCAGGYGTKKGFCLGDSGGPLVCGAEAVGVVSFNLGDCGYPNVPNIYTDLSHYLTWIRARLKDRRC